MLYHEVLDDPAWVELALIRKAGTHEKASGGSATRWGQRVPPSWLPDSKSFQGGFELETFYLFSTEPCSFFKTDRMLQSLLIICISTAFVVAARTEPSPTSNHITSRIPRQSVQSSAIAKVGYSKRRHILEIEFVNGAVYRYLDVPVIVYRDLMSAESKARFYDSNIRRHYRSVLVRQREKQEPPEKHPTAAQRSGPAARE
jgi:hypothetical protein